MSLSTVLSQKLPADDNMPTILIYFRYISGFKNLVLKNAFKKELIFCQKILILLE